MIEKRQICDYRKLGFPAGVAPSNFVLLLKTE